MPIMAFENGEVVWINKRGKEFLHINDILELKDKSFLKRLMKRLINFPTLLYHLDRYRMMAPPTDWQMILRMSADRMPWIQE
jgi:hypothetical protein